MKPKEILLVEDNRGDVRLTLEAFKESSIPTQLHVVHDGAEALKFLDAASAPGSLLKPDLILLDLNLPKVTGHEVLARIKEHAQWRVIPVVVLTTSSSERDVLRCYAQHANCYITKPMNFVPFLEVVKSIESYWLKLARLPRRTLHA